MITKYLLTTMLIVSISISDELIKIPEASGIDYCKDSNTLVVANDEGWIYEITTNGKIINKKRVKKYDLEGVVCNKKNFIFVVEDKGLLKVNRQTYKSKLIKVNPMYQRTKIELFDKDRGVEGIAKGNGYYYLAKQSNKRDKSFIAVIKIERNRADIIDIIRHKIVDTAGLTYKKNNLYMVSDKKNQMIKYNIKKRKIVAKIKLDNMAQEGIAFDKDGFIYIADDNGKVIKVKSVF
ncbi:MAG: SdiA-regulated domain-containing protein [Sulfurovum sp.]|nr:SdiA-regulated domain-containing protein [Sulfurovaceae bacterium]